MSTQRARKRLADFSSEVMYFLKMTLALLRHNGREVVAFILLCSVFSVMLTSMMTSAVTDALMLVAGTTYIAPENLLQVLLNPLGLAILLVEQMLATLLVLFQIAGLLHAFSMAQIGRETNLASMLVAGLRTCRKALHPKNWLIVPFVLVFLPLTKIISLSSTTYKLVIPGFINQTIEYTPLYRVLYIALYVALLLLLLMYVFALNIFVLRKDSFLKSCMESRRLGRRHYLNTVLVLGVVALLIELGINTLASGITINVSEIVAYFSNSLGIVTRSAAVGTYTYALREVLQSLIVPAVNNACLTVLFYHYIDEDEQIRTLSPVVFRREVMSARAKRVAALAVAATLVGTTVFLVTKYSFLAEPVDRPLVCAHRGDNVNAPENTMPAFELAFSENLKWIELDVHQTSDDVIVCSHDASIGRVTGHDLKIREHTLAELKQCEMLDSMPGAYEHVTIPTLEEVLLAAKEKGVNVQVELKGSKTDKNFEEHVLEVIEKAGMHDNVMVIGQDANRMKRVAELDPTITKGYCMFVAQGNVEDIPYTDNVTIEETNVTPELVHRLHEEGVMVFCWTVDLEDTVQYLVSCDVDVIGTDDPLLISGALDHSDYRGGLPRVLNIFLEVIANMAR